MAQGTDLFVGVTDNAWYRFLAAAGMTEVNFWRPSAVPFRALAPGGLFLFKLHAPIHAIAGGGFFVSSLQLTVRQAWDWFGTANGCATLDSLLDRLRLAPSRQITCILLGDVFYFPKERWIPAPRSFHPSIQVGKGYRIAEEPDLVQMVRAHLQEAGGGDSRPAAEALRTGTPGLVLPRVGQRLFRGLVAAAYDRRCAVTRERALPVLEAAHIVPFAAGGSHAVENGLLLRSDLHRLFDTGYITVDPDRRVLMVSRRLRTEFHNGEEYLRLDGAPLARPAPGYPSPSRENLRFHRENVFVA
jgi:putative restriction endonuclease